MAMGWEGKSQWQWVSQSQFVYSLVTTAFWNVSVSGDECLQEPIRRGETEGFATTPKWPGPFCKRQGRIHAKLGRLDRTSVVWNLPVKMHQHSPLEYPKKCLRMPFPPFRAFPGIWSWPTGVKQILGCSQHINESMPTDLAGFKGIVEAVNPIKAFLQGTSAEH